MTSTEEDEVINSKILNQIDYYFGDINLPQDKFLQEEIKKDEGWITFEVLLNCNRIKKLTTDKALIAAAVKNTEIIEVSEDGTKIRRNPSNPVPEHDYVFMKSLHERTVYIKGFPLETTLDDILTFLQPYGIVVNVVMRKHRLYKSFKGSIFATFKDKESAEKFVANEIAQIYKDNELVRMMQYDYWSKKSAEKKEKKALKEQEKFEYLKGQILYVTELPTENVDLNLLKEFLMDYGNVAYVDYVDGSSDACVGFEAEEENGAVKAMEKINEAATKNDGKFLFQDKEIVCEVLEGEEEEKYWLDYKAAANKEAPSRKRGKKRPYYKRGNYFKNKKPRTDDAYRLKRKEENCRLRDLRLKKKKLKKHWKDTKAAEE